MGQTKLPGYKTLSDEQLAIMKDNKLLEEIVLRQVDNHVRQNGSNELDQRWVSIARTHFQEGFMALSRAVAQHARIRPNTEAVEGFAVDVERLVDKLVRS